MQTAPAQPTRTPHPLVRAQVAKLLQSSPAFEQLDPKTKTAVAKATAQVADYLARPEDIPGNEIAGGLGVPPAEALAGGLLGDDKSASEASFAERQAAVAAIGQDDFRADAAREGAAVAGELLREVKFPEFVGGLIQGVFQSIVTSSIEQMEQYSKMIAQVAQSLEQFMNDNVSENQGRDHMVDQFPDLFEIGIDDFAETPGPRLQLREDVDENDALRKVNNSITFENGEMKSLDLSDENVETVLVQNARLQLAKQRQQLMASLVIMGINRIVVTDGRIAAKILYDFRARDRKSTRRSATAMDVARDRFGNVQTTSSGEGEYDVSSERERDYGDDDDKGGWDASYYSKGKYKYENKPVVTAMSSATAATDAELQTKVQLAGNVEVNFKSDYLPLDKMATPGMIAAIQGNSTPVDPNVIPSARQAPGARAGRREPRPGHQGGAGHKPRRGGPGFR
ncbi:MAG: hypothetical protein KJN93_08225, partial [Alphaproteobacteria bacterium]|nr:hypothetical protein [Alphaproteobacteria bacterium]